MGPAIAPKPSHFHWHQLASFRCVPHTAVPVALLRLINENDPNDADAADDLDTSAAPVAATKTTAASNAGKAEVPSELHRAVLEMCNGSAAPKAKLIASVCEAHSSLVKAAVERFINAACVKERRNGARAWFVTDEWCVRVGINPIVNTETDYKPRVRRRKSESKPSDEQEPQPQQDVVEDAALPSTPKRKSVSPPASPLSSKKQHVCDDVKLTHTLSQDSEQSSGLSRVFTPSTPSNSSGIAATWDS